MAQLTIEKLHTDFGARITGVDLRMPLNSALLGEIRSAIDEYSFLHFPNQVFDDDLHFSFTENLGEPEENHVTLGEDGKVNYFGTIGNVQPDGTKLGNRDRKTIFLTGNNLWHTDSSFRPVPAFVSINYVYEAPEEGGLTEYVSARAAYNRLTKEKKAEIDCLTVVHDYVFSRSKIAPDAVSPSLAESLPPIPQKLVRTNPNTGAKNYYIGSHAKAIDGWSEEDSRALIDDLLARATRPQDIYRHRWQAEDLVIWDNRCLLHRGTGYDADKYRRYMRQTRVRGSGPTLAE